MKLSTVIIHTGKNDEQHRKRERQANQRALGEEGRGYLQPADK